MPDSSGKAQSSSSIITPLTACWALRQVEQLEDDRLVFAEHFAGGDPEKQAIADLAGSAGNGDTKWGFGHMSPDGGRIC